MAALTVIAPSTSTPGYGIAETIAITNQDAASTAVTKAIQRPSWAKHLIFVIDNLTMTGTTPLFDFILYGVNVAVTAEPDGGDLFTLGGWDGITQKTGATASQTVVDVGPEYTADDVGSATVSDRYCVQSAIPPWIAYKYTTAGGGAAKEDYAADLCYYWLP